MNLLKISRKPLAQAEIIERLGKLRLNSLVDSSHFSVSAIVELKLGDGSYAYVSGVNVENAGHNRLGMHAEQSALVAAQSLFGGDIKFMKAWVMGAPKALVKGSEDPLADNYISPCGHCRQILLGFSLAETEIYSVSVNGKVGSPESLSALLPHAFSELDLKALSADVGSASFMPVADLPAKASGTFLTEEPKLLAWQLLQRSVELDDADIRFICAAAKSHVIDSKFITGPIQACLIKAVSDRSSYYFLGTLVQDIAFLTTDAVFSCVAQAVTEFGGSDLKFEEIHVYGSLDPSSLSGAELQHLARFSSLKTPIKFHSSEASSRVFRLEECFEVFRSRLFLDMHPKAGSVSCPAVSDSI